MESSVKRRTLFFVYLNHIIKLDIYTNINILEIYIIFVVIKIKNN